MTERDEFSVYVFFPDGVYHCERRDIDAETAVKTAHRLSRSVGGRLGVVRRIIITDGGDCICFEWKPGEGVTFPKPSHEENAA
jgi:hypothetical protein